MDSTPFKRLRLHLSQFRYSPPHQAYPFHRCKEPRLVCGGDALFLILSVRHGVPRFLMRTRISKDLASVGPPHLSNSPSQPLMPRPPSLPHPWISFSTPNPTRQTQAKQARIIHHPTNHNLPASRPHPLPAAKLKCMRLDAQSARPPLAKLGITAATRPPESPSRTGLLCVFVQVQQANRNTLRLPTDTINPNVE